jgi:hypothetical protein
MSKNKHVCIFYIFMSKNKHVPMYFRHFLCQKIHVCIFDTLKILEQEKKSNRVLIHAIHPGSNPVSYNAMSSQVCFEANYPT